jgi:hypothetical protein
MDRKEALEALGLLTVGPALFLKSFKTDGGKTAVVQKDNLDKVGKAYEAGRQKWELARLKKILDEPDFFDEHEMRTITALSDIIIPKDNVSGSASDAKVPEFIAFIVKDMPGHQLPMRGGLKWLDTECRSRYGQSFVDCNSKQQLEMVEAIAYPEKAKPEMQQGVAFFNRMRSLTASGFYTTKIGIKDIGYKGNRPTQWTGVPEEVLAQYDVENF